MKFFDTNFLFKVFGGFFNASSGTPEFAFNDNSVYSWTSSGEGTDGNSVFVERILDQATTMNRIFLQETNISNYSIEIDSGSGYLPLVPTATVTSLSGKSHLISFANLLVSKLKISGSNTLPANQEKVIQNIYGFMEIGTIIAVDSTRVSHNVDQKVSNMLFGGKDIINIGMDYEFTISLKANNLPDDVATFETIRYLGREMYLWINDNSENVFKVFQRPYRFQDIYRVSREGKIAPRYEKDFVGSGITDSIKLVEMSKII